MWDLVFKLLELIEKATAAGSASRKEIFNQHIDPTFRELANAHAEFVRALRSIQASAKQHTDISLLLQKTSQERDVGRAQRAAAFAQSSSLRQSLKSLIEKLESSPNALIRPKRPELKHALRFADACANYFGNSQMSPVIKHELSWLLRVLEESNLSIDRLASKSDNTKSSTRNGQSNLNDVATLRYALDNNRETADGIVAWCDIFVEVRNERWEVVAQTYAQCRMELLRIA